MSTRQLTLGNFAAHCLDEIKAVQNGDTVIEILSSSGKVVAVLSPPELEEPAGTLADWMGSGAGTMSYGPGYDPEAPTFMDADDAQGFWNDLSAQQCAALQRVPITRRAEDFFGDGKAEEWEGFDEALEQWRSETIPSGGQSHAA
jgi:hypothetical protein